MKEIFSRWTVPLLVVVLIIALTAVTRLRVPAAGLEKVAVEITVQQAGSERGRRVDAILGDNLTHLAATPQLRDSLHIGSGLVTLKRFWIDSCEVSQRQFEEFLLWRKSNPATGVFRLQPPDWEFATTSNGHRIAGRLQSPATGVSFYDAFAYCVAAGGYLPSSEQWQAAAGGKKGRLYPWGDEFNRDAWPYSSAELNAAQSCGLHTQAATPDGIFDLVSGAAEWSSGPLGVPPEQWQPYVHGADQLSSLPVRALNGVYRSAEPSERNHKTGFRCAYSRPPGRLLPWGGQRETVVRRGGEYLIGLPADSHLARLVPIMTPQVLKELAEPLRGETGSLISLSVSSCEINRSSYALFLRDPLVRLGLFANDAEPENFSYVPLDWEQQLKEPKLPVYGVSWWAADAYSRWSGGRLPSAEEWDLMAAGGRASRYPWGDELEQGSPVTAARRDSRIFSCASGGNDLSHSGLWDLGGNLSEWTRSISASQRRIGAWVKGGSYLLPNEASEVGFGRTVPLNHRARDIGFRVVFD